MQPQNTSEELASLKQRNEELFLALERKTADLEAAAQRLRRQEEIYQLSFEHAQDVVYIIASNLEITNVSPSVEKVLGYRPEDFLGRPVTALRDFFSPGSYEQVVHDALAMLKSENMPRRIYEFIVRDGTIRYGEISGATIKRQGRIAGWIAIVRDVTSRRQAEKTSRDMMSFLKTLLDTIPSPIFYKDIQGVYRECNREFAAYMGLKREEIIGRNAHTLFPKYLADKYHAKDQELHAEPGRQEYEHPIRYADGEIRDVVVNKATFVDADGILAGVVGVMVDISERKKVEEALRTSEQRLCDILNFLPEATMVVDRTGKVAAWNRAMEIMTGVPAGEMLGKGNYEYSLPFYGQRRPILIDLAINPQLAQEVHYQDLQRTGDVLFAEAYTPNLPGGRSYMSAIATVLRDSQGGITGAIECIRDNTEKKKTELERQLREQRQRMEILKKSLRSTIQVIASLVETRDPFTAGHQHRVADLAGAIAMELELSVDQIESVRAAGAIHDLGKIAVPADILTIPRKLSALERAMIETYAQAGHDIIKDIEFPWPLARMILEHHERLDGSGYPYGLTGKDLLLESRIIMVADVVEAMSSHRPYRPALGMEAAREEIMKNRATRYDPEVVDACLRLFEDKKRDLPDDASRWWICG